MDEAAEMDREEQIADEAELEEEEEAEEYIEGDEEEDDEEEDEVRFCLAGTCFGGRPGLCCGSWPGLHCARACAAAAGTHAPSRRASLLPTLFVFLPCAPGGG